MNAADHLRRLELRERWSRFAWVAIALFVVLGLGAVALQRLHDRAFHAGRTSEKNAQIRKTLKDNSDKLRLAAIHRDSTKKEATKAVTASTTHRDSSRGTVGTVRPTSDTTLQIGTLPPLVMPKVGVDAYRDLLESRRRDSTTIASLQSDVAAVEVEKGLLEARGTTLEAREANHADEVKAEGKRGFWRGVKTGMVGTIVVIGSLLVVGR